MQIDVITIFPKMFDAVLNESIIKRAKKAGIVKINLHNLRDFTKDRHRKVDDRPFGGGPGMVMKPEPIFSAVESTLNKNKKAKVILLTPQGEKLNQRKARQLSKAKQLILICPHYEGIDERVRRHLADEEISIGDYVLTGGELPAMVLIDSMVRLLPGAIGHKDATKDESFSDGLLEYPHYTRPSVFRKLKVPEILLSGDPKLVAEWRKKESIKRTKQRRPDLLEKD